jgi:hypothetical protein
MSRLVTPLSCEILDLIKAEYQAGHVLPAVEEAVAAAHARQRSEIIFGKFAVSEKS